MFCFFAIAPHAPVLAPTVGKEEYSMIINN